MSCIEVLILTKSSKNGGKCVAGVNIKNREWVRLVSDDSDTHGAIPNSYLRYINRAICDVLDVVKVEMIKRTNDELQPENILIDLDTPMSFIRKGSLQEALELIEETERDDLFGNTYSYVSERKIHDVGYSLTLIKVCNLRINQVEIDGKPKTRADFIYNNILYEGVSVTDPCFYNTLDGTIYKEAYIVVSIGTPFNERYYKFVASIFAK